MKKTPLSERAGTGSFPAVFSYINLRPEACGALAFNPKSGREARLDREQARIAFECDGTNTRKDIEAKVSKRFRHTSLEAEKLVYQVFEKLDEIDAICFCDKPGPARFKKKALPKQVVDGPRLVAPRNVTWEVTYACNLRCPHCFTGAGKKARRELDTEQAFALVDRLASMQVFTVLLSGGEPFLRPDIMDLLKRIAAARIRIDIGSNGTAVPDEIVRRLWHVPVSHVHVSIDGIGAGHDRFRGKKGAFNEACSTITKLRSSYVPVSISMAVTAENKSSVDDVIDLALELKCKSFKAIPFIPIGRGSANSEGLSLTLEDREKLFRRLVERAGELKGRLTIDTGSCFPFLIDGSRPDITDDGPMGCPAGDDTLMIAADGTVYPCPYLREFPLGNAVSDDLAELWKSSPTLRELRSLRKKQMHEPCRSCPYAPAMCKGGCRAAAYLEEGDLRACDPGCFRPVSGAF